MVPLWEIGQSNQFADLEFHSKKLSEEQRDYVFLFDARADDPVPAMVLCSASRRKGWFYLVEMSFGMMLAVRSFIWLDWIREKMFLLWRSCVLKKLYLWGMRLQWKSGI